MKQDVIERILARAGHEPALEIWGAQTMTAAELAADVQRCAAWMAEQGVRRGGRVLVDAGRSAEHVIAMLGCWWLGAVFVPLECCLPAARRRALAARVSPALDPGTWSRSLWSAQAPMATRARISGADLAYIAFTSGSSGEPKGALISHAGLGPLASAQAELFQVAAGDRSAWGLSAHFDASFSDILVPLWAGATLVVLPEGGPSLLDAAVDARLTHVDLPPSQLAALLVRGAAHGLKTVIVGGEPAPRAVLRQAAEQLRVVNVYGPTETTVCVSAEVVGAKAPERASIGWPLPGVQLRTAPGGELLIGGDFVGLGYLDSGDDGRFFLEDGVRWCASGDLARREDDGSFTFLGRLDRQVQIRGRRIEPEEIERALARHPDVRGAAVLARGGTEPLLAAFVEGGERSAKSEAALMRWLAERIEPWKLPRRIQVLGALPRLGNAKIDYGALGQELELGKAPRAASQSPLTMAWATVFGDAARGADEDFMERGGDSVRALELCVEAGRLGVLLEPEAIELTPRLGDLEQAVRRGMPTKELLQDARARASAIVRAPKVAHDPGPPSILLTGATGFLGPWLVEALHDRGARVTALVRSRDGLLFPPGVRVVLGDVSRLGLGLAPIERAELRSHVTQIVHAAGVVDVTRAASSLAPVNVDGTAHALQLAADLGARFDFVSTLSVFAESACALAVVPDGLELEAAQRLFGGYAQTKWVAEALTREVGLEGAVFRLGLLTGKDRWSRPQRDQLSRVIRGLCALGRWPTHCDERLFDATPVRVAAQVMAQFILAREAPARPLHIAREAPAKGAALAEAMEAEGVPLERVAHWPPRFAAPTRDHPGRPDVALALAAASVPLADRHGRPARAGDLFLRTDMDFDVARAVQASEAGLRGIPNPAMLRSLVRAALASADRE